MNYGILVTMAITKFLRGSGGGKKSILGLEICDGGSWALVLTLIVIAAILTYLAGRIAKNEFEEKKSLGYKFTKGDQEFNLGKIAKLASVAFVVAFFASLAGIGPGLIFNTVLV